MFVSLEQGLALSRLLYTVPTCQQGKKMILCFVQYIPLQQSYLDVCHTFHFSAWSLQRQSALDLGAGDCFLMIVRLVSAVYLHLGSYRKC